MGTRPSGAGHPRMNSTATTQRPTADSSIQSMTLVPMQAVSSDDQVVVVVVVVVEQHSSKESRQRRRNDNNDLAPLHSYVPSAIPARHESTPGNLRRLLSLRIASDSCDLARLLRHRARRSVIAPGAACYDVQPGACRLTPDAPAHRASIPKMEFQRGDRVVTFVSICSTNRADSGRPIHCSHEVTL
jgi:hypothetical protein